MIELALKLAELSERGQAFVMVTLLQIKGSAPQIEGAKMLVTNAGLYWGTVGGGKIEAHCIQHALSLLEKPQPADIRTGMKTWNLQTDIGMSCGGEVTFFFDVSIPNNWPIAVFGAGHVSQMLCRLLSTMECTVHVFDSRPEWLEKIPANTRLTKTLSARPADEVARLPRGCYLLCMTQGHAIDLPILTEAFRRPGHFKMIGAIGSALKAKKLKLELRQAGIAPHIAGQLVSPMGLPIGNNTPAEIAISICSQLLAVRDALNFSVRRGFVSDRPHDENQIDVRQFITSMESI